MTELLPLGDQAALAYFANESAAIRFARAVGRLNEAWLVDVVVAYQSVAVFFDLGRIRFAEVADTLRRLGTDLGGRTDEPAGALHQIPCCYDLQCDMGRVSEATGLSADEVIGWHSGTQYTVYAIGFCPGFPYLGYLPGPLCNVPRLARPRLRVDAGSVGLTGRQTGIYTEVRPGGWNIVGRTPLQLVNVADGYFPLAAGDRVQFVPIGRAEFDRVKGNRLDRARRR